MIPDLWWDQELFITIDMIEHLKQIFCQQAIIERFENFRSLHGCKIEQIGNISTHVLKMKNYMHQLERLSSPYPHDMATDLIKNSLAKSYDTFIMK